jgi:hypothetical protein
MRDFEIEETFHEPERRAMLGLGTQIWGCD